MADTRHSRTAGATDASPLDDLPDVYRASLDSFFSLFERLCEGALAVDARANIVWINHEYRQLLGIPEHRDVTGLAVEQVIPNSLMRQVVNTGKPMLLDIMRFDNRSFVVTRLPTFDAEGRVIGAVGFVLYDEVDYLKPLLNKFAALQAELTRAKAAISAQRRPKYTFSQIAGLSPAIRETKHLARRAAEMDSNVLLLGETGTGKELIAHAIHAASGRAGKPFVSINVAAIPESLLEAEFFGVVPGAFTGADRKAREGKLKVAEGGTLFLDEIGDMPLHLQAKLLRVLQEREFEAVGSNEVQSVEVRVIAATSRHLKGLVDEGKFRADLYYRLNVLPITMPPLRERLEDIGLLAEVLLEEVAAQTGSRHLSLSDDALVLLQAYDWPGNVRELRNLLEQAAVSGDSTVISREVLHRCLTTTGWTGRTRRSVSLLKPLAALVAEAEIEALTEAMRHARGNRTDAAKLLGISRATFYQKLTKHRLMSDK